MTRIPSDISNRPIHQHGDGCGCSGKHHDKSLPPSNLVNITLETSSPIPTPAATKPKHSHGHSPNKNSFSENFFTMLKNLAPALLASESVDYAGDQTPYESTLDYLKPVAAIFTRQGVIDGINKQNAYKPIASSVSAMSLMALQRFVQLPKFVIRPILGLMIYLVEGFEDIKNLNTATPKGAHTEKPKNKKDLKTLLFGLGAMEIQLNTISPSVSKLETLIFSRFEKSLFRKAGKYLFQTVSLSAGFAAFSSGISSLANLIIKNKSKNSWLYDALKSIIPVECGCCGQTACINSLAEDISATSSVDPTY